MYKSHLLQYTAYRLEKAGEKSRCGLLIQADLYLFECWKTTAAETKGTDENVHQSPH